MSDRVFLDANPAACCVFEPAVRLTAHYRERCRTPCGVSFIKTRSRAAFDALGAATDDVMAIIPGPFAVQEQAP